MEGLPLQQLEYPNLGTWFIVRLCFSFWLDAQFATTSGHHPRDMILEWVFQDLGLFYVSISFVMLKLWLLFPLKEEEMGEEGDIRLGGWK